MSLNILQYNSNKVFLHVNIIHVFLLNIEVDLINFITQLNHGMATKSNFSLS